jgi:tetratricopeptide (TPR) repeat protein
MIYTLFQDFEASLEKLTFAIKLNPSNSNFYVNRGVILHRLGNKAVALQNYRRCLDLDRDNQSALFNMGLLYLEFQQFEFALEVLDRLIMLEPNDPQPRVARAIAHFLHKGSLTNIMNSIIKTLIFLDLPNSKRDFEEALLMGGDQFSIYYHRAEMYSKFGLAEDSRRDYETCKEIDSRFAGEIDEKLQLLSLSHDCDVQKSKAAKKYMLKKYAERLSLNSLSF